LLFGLGLDKYSHNVALLHYEILDIINFDLSARPFAEQNAIADLDVDRNELAALVAAARADGRYPALLRFLPGGVGNDYAAGALRLCLDALDVKRGREAVGISLVSSCGFTQKSGV